MQRINYFKILEWSLFLGLCGISAIFMQGVLNKYFSGKTSIAQSESTITELPTVVLCFTIPNSRTTDFEYGSDFKIKYSVTVSSGESAIFLEQGKYAKVMGESINFENITTENLGYCYKLTSNLTYGYMIKEYTDFQIYFNESIPQEDLPSLKIYLTSEKISYGIVYSRSRWGGKMMKIHIEKHMNKVMELKQEMRSFLPTNSKCSHESNIECIGRLLKANLNSSSSPCSMISFPHLPICKINKTKDENDMFWSLWKKFLKECPSKLCINVEYSGEENFYEKLHDKNMTIKFRYRFSSNSTTVYEEYLIYDIISVIGSVGGTLGMCIGFSFTGLISSLINLLQHGIMTIVGKNRSQNHSKSNQNNEFEKNARNIETNHRIHNGEFVGYKNKITNAERISYIEGKLKNEIMEKLEEKLNANIKEIANDNIEKDRALDLKLKAIERKINQL